MANLGGEEAVADEALADIAACDRGRRAIVAAGLFLEEPLELGLEADLELGV